MAADWSELYHDLLVEIAERLTQFKDYIAFGMVCRSWRLAAVKKNFRFNININDQVLLPKFPLLMLAPTTKGKPGIINYRCFYNLSNGKTLQVWLPKLVGKRCYTSRGWLITVGRDLGVSLFHPFVSVEIKLPNLKTLKNWEDPTIAGMIMLYAHLLKKCALCSNPLAAATSNNNNKKKDDDYIMMVIYGSVGKLGYYKSGDKTWNMIDTGDRRGFFDVIYFKDFFYAINGMGDVLVFERDNLKRPTKVLPMPEHLTEEIIEQLYLVESDEEGQTLFVVFRDGVQGIKGNYGTYNFRVFEVDLTTNTWDEVNNLGNKSFFLGHNSSISLTIDAASNSHIKPNCIYFTDDYWGSNWCARQGGGKDMGIYNLQTQTVEPHFQGKSFNLINPPMWI